MENNLSLVKNQFKELPINIESEQAVIGSILVSNDKFDEIVHKEKQMNSKGIEVGHIFHFGTKYSNSMKANVLDSDGKEKTVHMGSYGIGISRLVGAIIESSHDESGIIWSDAVSPFTLGVINLKPKDDEASSIANKVYNQIDDKSEVLFLSLIHI